MSPTVLTDLVEFAYAHPWIVAARVAIVLGLIIGVAAYRRLYMASKSSAAESAALIDHLTEGVYRSSPDGKQISANRALVRLNGYESEAEQLAAVKDIALEWYVDDDRRAEFKALMDRNGQVENFVSEIYRHKTRERIWISESARVVRDPKTKEIRHYEGSVREITDSIKRREIEERFRKLTDMLPGGLFQLVRSPDGKFTAPYVSSGFCRTVGIDETDRVSDPFSYYQNIHPDDQDHYAATLRQSGIKLTTWNVEFRVISNGSDERWLHVVAQPETSQKTITWHGYVSDITARKRQELEIEEMAYVDPLTNLPNRRYLMDRIEQVAADCQRKKQLAAGVYVDLDHFKDLNDMHGHETGDLFLTRVADRLNDAVRKGDTVARIGGDEFFVLLQPVGHEDWKAKENAISVADKILNSLRQPYQLERLTYEASASLGVVVFDGSNGGAEGVLKQADQAMYEAKSNGRDAIGTAFSTPAKQTDEATDDDVLCEQMPSAIRQRELRLQFQPQVGKRGELVGAEGFLHWYHPQFGSLPASHVLPIARRAGLSTELDLLAIEIAIETLSIWQRTPGLQTLRLAINAGTSTLLDERSYTQIKTMIEQHRIRPGMLTIEITEQVQRSARDTVESKMSALKELGIRFALDDFGSGYSSITYLRQLNFDEVKIEGAFVAGIDGDEDNEALVKTILAMAGTLGITAVAEHVDNESQQDFLRAYGCDVFQGKQYGEAMDGDAFSRFVVSQSDTGDPVGSTADESPQQEIPAKSAGSDPV